MPLTVGVLKENLEGETRVALTPEITGKLQKLGVSVIMEKGAGDGSQIPDDEYADVEFTDSGGVLAKCGLLFTVQPADPDAVNKLGDGSVVAGLMYGHNNPDLVKALQGKKHVGFAMELVPRISRAQSMDHADNSSRHDTTCAGSRDRRRRRRIAGDSDSKTAGRGGEKL
jgi:NAD(P) transhydrogenase subunit alpha